MNKEHASDIIRATKHPRAEEYLTHPEGMCLELHEPTTEALLADFAKFCEDVEEPAEPTGGELDDDQLRDLQLKGIRP